MFRRWCKARAVCPTQHDSIFLDHVLKKRYNPSWQRHLQVRGGNREKEVKNEIIRILRTKPAISLLISTIRRDFEGGRIYVLPPSKSLLRVQIKRLNRIFAVSFHFTKVLKCNYLRLYSIKIDMYGIFFLGLPR